MCKQVNHDDLGATIKKALADIHDLSKAREVSQSQLLIPMTAPVICLTDRRNKATQGRVLQRLLLAAKTLKW